MLEKDCPLCKCMLRRNIGDSGTINIVCECPCHVNVEPPLEMTTLYFDGHTWREL